MMRNCLSKIWNKQFLIFLFFLLLSAAFWVFQALNETFEEDFQVKVEIKNVPEGAIITTEAVPAIDITLRDRGVTLLNYKYGFNFNPIVIDYNEYANSTGHVRILTRDVLRKVTSQLATSTQVVTTKPDTIEFYYNHGLHKRVPVVLEGNIRTANGYTVTKTTLSNDSVTVYAASSLLEDIDVAYAKVDYLKTINNTTSMGLKIQSVRGAKFIPDTVNLKVDIDRLVEKKLNVPIQAEGFPSDLVLLPIPQETEVTFLIGMDRYSKVTPDDFTVVAHYEDLPQEGSHVPLRLVKTPDDAIRARISPNKIEYVIEKVFQFGDLFSTENSNFWRDR